MGLNIQKGNMYGWVTHTYNTVKGKCPHDCVYCYMKMFKLKPMRFDDRELKTDLGRDNVIFVGSGNDMWGDEVPKDWIERTLTHCRKYDKNTYLFQSKNPVRFMDFTLDLPPKTILGTTIETDSYRLDMAKVGFPISKAPSPLARYSVMVHPDLEPYQKMISIEPILKFNITNLVKMIEMIDPKFVSIGADSKKHGLPEPTEVEIGTLVTAVTSMNIQVKLKPNLRRLVDLEKFRGKINVEV